MELKIKISRLYEIISAMRIVNNHEMATISFADEMVELAGDIKVVFCISPTEIHKPRLDHTILYFNLKL
jgi:hypothetical protein